MDKYTEPLGMIDSHILSQNTKLDIVQLIKMFEHKIVPFPHIYQSRHLFCVLKRTISMYAQKNHLIEMVIMCAQKNHLIEMVLLIF